MIVMMEYGDGDNEDGASVMMVHDDDVDDGA